MPVDVNLVRAFDRERDALRRVEHDRVRVAEAQIQLLARLGGAITDALNLEALAEALCDAFDHVADQRARQTVRRTMRLRIALALDDAPCRLRVSRRRRCLRMWLRSSPLGPLTTTSPSPSLTLTPLGTATGNLPIRDMFELPHVREDFTADTELLRSLAGHDALWRRHDDEAETAEHARDLRLARVDAQAGTRDAAQAGDDLLFFRTVLERDANRALRPFVQALEIRR